MVTPVTLRISPISMRTCTSPTHAPDHLVVDSVIHSLTQSFVRAFIRSRNQSVIHLVIKLVVHSFIQSVGQSVTHSTRSIVHSSLSCMTSFASWCIQSAHIDSPCVKLPSRQSPSASKMRFAQSRVYTSVKDVTSSAHPEPAQQSVVHRDIEPSSRSIEPIMQKGIQRSIVAPGLEHVQPTVVGTDCTSRFNWLSACSGECFCAVLRCWQMTCN